VTAEEATFLRVLPAKWRRKPAGIAMERNRQVILVLLLLTQSLLKFAKMKFGSMTSQTAAWYLVRVLYIRKNNYQLSLTAPRDGIVLKTELDDHCDN